MMLPSINLDRTVLSSNTCSSKSIPTEQFVREMKEKQLQLIKRAQAHQKAKDLKNLASRAKDMCTEYAPGTYVLAEYHSSLRKGAPNKLLTRLRGPLQVVSSSKSNYKLLNLVSNTFEHIHITVASIHL